MRKHLNITRRIEQLEEFTARLPEWYADQYAAHLRSLSDPEFEQKVKEEQKKFLARGLLIETATGYQVPDSFPPGEDRELLERFAAI